MNPLITDLVSLMMGTPTERPFLVVAATLIDKIEVTMRVIPPPVVTPREFSVALSFRLREFLLKARANRAHPSFWGMEPINIPSQSYTVFQMKVMLWNCRGAGGRNLMRQGFASNS